MGVPVAEKGAVWGGRERDPSQRRGSSQGSPGGGPSRAERQVGWFLSKDAPEGGGDHDAQDHTAELGFEPRPTWPIGAITRMSSC